MKPYFTVLTLGVDNLDASLAFYRDGLGLPTKVSLEPNSKMEPWFFSIFIRA